MSKRTLAILAAAAITLLVAAPGASAKHVAAAAVVKKAAACKDATLEPGRGRLQRMRAATICLINHERAKRGLRKLTRSTRLTAAASAHSVDMVKNKYFGHSTRRNPVAGLSSLSSEPLARVAWRSGENIAWGTRWRGSPKTIVGLWMGSPGHRANLLNPGFREIGVGIALGNPFKGIIGGATYTASFYSKI
jgi:uncharacterized protein YkwD